MQGQCSDRAPPSFKLKQRLPPGACGILVKEGFLDIPLGTFRGLLLDSLYVAQASPAGGGNSNLILHVRPCSLNFIAARSHGNALGISRMQWRPSSL